MNDLTRRDLLKAGAGLSLGLTLGGLETAHAGVARAPAAGKRVLRIAHMTDVHIQPEKRAGQGMVAALHHVQSQKDRPDIIFNGGDSIMDALEADKARAKLQWDLWNKVLKDECSLPVEHCIGNHDVWGWAKKQSGCTGNEDLYGKKWAVDEFNISNRFRSFDRAGWHFIVLDSTHPHQDSYMARLDEEQFEWLEDDLRKTGVKTPVLVLSHIPILSACVIYPGNLESEGRYNMPPGWIHLDSRRIKNLFARHPNVKVCLSGHLHLVERVEYNGVTYLCDGAVCGGWWDGPHQEWSEGYALVDLYDDGRVDRQYVTYGWKAERT